MNPEIIAEMVRVLRPALKDQDQATKLLERYWRDKIALIWTSKNLLRAANEQGLVLRLKEANYLLADTFKHYNPQYGLEWTDLWDVIKESGVGRKMTKQEIRAFVEDDTVAIERRRR